jgi:PBP1b-binding outer membrane lipoprotein LpoB
MKYYILIPILAIFILAGCSKQNSVTAPISSQTQSNRQWIKINHTPSLSVENTYSASKSIDGNKGGTVELSQTFRNNGNWALVTAKLTIPKGAFSGTQVISYTVNTETAGIDFSPNSTSFDKNLSLDLVFTGVDISGYDASKLKFAYLDGNVIIPAFFTYVNADIAQGLLVVLGAQISHFSRYGWSTIDDPSLE